MRTRGDTRIVQLMTLLLVFGGVNTNGSEADVTNEASAYVSGELLIKFKPGTARARADEAQSALGAREIREHPGIGVRHWRLGRGLTVERALEILSSPGRARFIEYAEPNYLYHTSELPNDPRFGDLYGLNNVGQTGGTADADIDAPEAWDVPISGDPIVVGVIDSGIDYNHADLQGVVWSNPNEIANGLDDDGNGYVDDLNGWDFVNNDADPIDDNNHGTHVAGTIAAIRGNGIGVAGVASNVRLIPLKFLNSGGSGSTENAILAIEYADSVGARITSNSWGGGNRSRALQDAIASSNALFVAAAGNGGSSSKQYPAGYDDAKIVSVAATDQNDALATFSNYGSSWVDLAAPGANILSTIRSGGYGLNSGTSMATPHVSGAAALVMVQNPGWDIASVKTQLVASVDALSSLAGKVASGGRLNLARAVGIEPPNPTADTTAPGDVANATAVAESHSAMRLDWTSSGDDGIAGTATAYDIRYLANATITTANWSTAKQATGEPAPAASGIAQSYVVTNLEASTAYGFGIRAIDDAGNVSAIVPVSATTPAGPWSITTIVPAAGSYTYSRELDFDGDTAGIAYENESQARYAYRDGGGTWRNELIDNSGGRGVSFRFAPDGTPTAAYSTFGARNGLEFASRNTSGVWTIATIESRDVSSDPTPLAYDSVGRPAIAYRGKGGVKLAQRASNGAWSTSVVNPSANARYLDLAFDGDTPWVAYSEDLNGDNSLESLMVVRRTSSGWTPPAGCRDGHQRLRRGYRHRDQSGHAPARNRSWTEQCDSVCRVRWRRVAGGGDRSELRHRRIRRERSAARGVHEEWAVVDCRQRDGRFVDARTRGFNRGRSKRDCDRWQRRSAFVVRHATGWDGLGEEKPMSRRTRSPFSIGLLLAAGACVSPAFAEEIAPHVSLSHRFVSLIPTNAEISGVEYEFTIRNEDINDLDDLRFALGIHAPLPVEADGQPTMRLARLAAGATVTTTLVVTVDSTSAAMARTSDLVGWIEAIDAASGEIVVESVVSHTEGN